MLFVYLISPIDIIPDFLPVIGFVDDLLIIVIMLHKIINGADETILKKIKDYWTGEDDVFVKIQEIITIMNEISSKIPKAIHNFMKGKK